MVDKIALADGNGEAPKDLVCDLLGENNGILIELRAEQSISLQRMMGEQSKILAHIDALWKVICRVDRRLELNGALDVHSPMSANVEYEPRTSDRMSEGSLSRPFAKEDTEERKRRKNLEADQSDAGRRKAMEDLKRKANGEQKEQELKAMMQRHSSNQPQSPEARPRRFSGSHLVVTMDRNSSKLSEGGKPLVEGDGANLRRDNRSFTGPKKEKNMTLSMLDDEALPLYFSKKAQQSPSRKVSPKKDHPESPSRKGASKKDHSESPSRKGSAKRDAHSSNSSGEPSADVWRIDGNTSASPSMNSLPSPARLLKALTGSASTSQQQDEAETDKRQPSLNDMSDSMSFKDDRSCTSQSYHSDGSNRSHDSGKKESRRHSLKSVPKTGSWKDLSIPGAASSGTSSPRGSPRDVQSSSFLSGVVSGSHYAIVPEQPSTGSFGQDGALYTSQRQISGDGSLRSSVDGLLTTGIDARRLSHRSCVSQNSAKSKASDQSFQSGKSAQSKASNQSYQSQGKSLTPTSPSQSGSMKEFDTKRTKWDDATARADAKVEEAALAVKADMQADLEALEQAFHNHNSSLGWNSEDTQPRSHTCPDLDRIGYGAAGPKGEKSNADFEAQEILAQRLRASMLSRQDDDDDVSCSSSSSSSSRSLEDTPANLQQKRHSDPQAKKRGSADMTVNSLAELQTDALLKSAGMSMVKKPSVHAKKDPEAGEERRASLSAHDLLKGFVNAVRGSDAKRGSSSESLGHAASLTSISSKSSSQFEKELAQRHSSKSSLQILPDVGSPTSQNSRDASPLSSEKPKARRDSDASASDESNDSFGSDTGRRVQGSKERERSTNAQRSASAVPSSASGGLLDYGLGASSTNSTSSRWSIEASEDKERRRRSWSGPGPDASPRARALDKVQDHGHHRHSATEATAARSLSIPVEPWRRTSVAIGGRSSLRIDTNSNSIGNCMDALRIQHEISLLNDLGQQSKNGTPLFSRTASSGSISSSEEQIDEDQHMASIDEEQKVSWILRAPQGVLNLYGITPFQDNFLSGVVSNLIFVIMLGLVAHSMVLVYDQPDGHYVHLNTAFYGMGGVCGVVFLRFKQIDLLLGPTNRPLDSYARNYGFIDEWHVISRWRFLAVFGFFSTQVLSRVVAFFGGGCGPELGGSQAFDGEVDQRSVQSLVAFIVISGLMAAITYTQLHVCCWMELSVDKFCFRFFAEKDIPNGINEWNVLQAVLRRAADKLDSCFLAIGTSVLATLLLSGLELMQGETGVFDNSSRECFLIWCGWIMPPVLMLLMVFFRAAAVTEKCSRVPALVNSWTFEDLATSQIDHGRQYAVQYIMHSGAGFYVKGVRLSAFMALKATYLLGIVTFTLVTQSILKSE